MRLADYVWDRVAAEGVDHVFMLPGGGCMHLVDALGCHPRLKFICNLHEQGTAVAADAYAQVRGFGVGLVTTGPGGTNAITGVAGAWLDSTPLLMISGQVKRADLKGSSGLRQLGFQEIGIVEMVKSITKYAVTVTDPLTIRHHLDHAIFEARHGRPGPVWLDIPLDVQAAEIDVEALEGFSPDADKTGGVKVIREAVRAFLEALEKVERPVIMLGNGVRLAGAVQKAITLIETLGIPILTTWKAADFLPENHPLFAGRPGTAGQRAANFAQQYADLILVIGARLDQGQVAYRPENFAPRAQKFIVDIDAAELAKHPMDQAHLVNADAGDFLSFLSLALEEGSNKRPSIVPWREQIKSWRDRYPVIQRGYWEEQGHVNLYVLVGAIASLLAPGEVVAPGSSGQCSEISCQAWPIQKGIRFVNSQGLGAMGFGVPGALGACLASGGKRTICLDGDGGFQMNAQELEVIRRLELPVKIFVLDNGGYGSIRGTQRNYFNGRLVASDRESGLTLPSALKIALAYDIPSAVLNDHEDVTEKLKGLLEAPGPLICQVHLNPDQPTQPRVTSYRKEDGSMASLAMEEMWPKVEEQFP